MLPIAARESHRRDRNERPSTDAQNLPLFSGAPEIPLKTVQPGAVKRPATKNLTNPAYARSTKVHGAAQAQKNRASGSSVAGASRGIISQFKVSNFDLSNDSVPAARLDDP